MKNRRILPCLLMLLAVILPLSGCGKQENDVPEGPGGPEVSPVFRAVPFRASASGGMGTKAGLSESNQYIFEAGDRLFITDQETSGRNLYGFLTIVSGEGTSNADFEGELMFADGYSASAKTALNATLVSLADKIHTIKDGKITDTQYPSDLYAGSFSEAVSSLSDFTAKDGTYSDPTFTLSQNSSFLIFSFSFDEDAVADEVTATITNGNGEQLRSAAVTTKEEAFMRHVGFVAAFKADEKLKDAVVSLDGEKYQIGEAGKEVSLSANKFYNVTRVLTTIDPDYLTIQASKDETRITCAYNTTHGIQYRKGKGEWQAYSASEVISLSAGEYVQFKGTGSKYQDKAVFTVAEPESHLCYIFGDLTSLLGDKTKVTNSAFRRAFQNATWIDIPAGRSLKLCAPDTKLETSCFGAMFYGCTSLTRAPELPATAIPQSGCSQMFQGCTSLVSAPDLPAEVYENSSFKQMFKDCSALIHGPASLPGTKGSTNGNNAFEEMFMGCTALTGAPEMPAAALYTSACMNMFRNCVSLTAAPALPATSISSNTYNGMFYGCTALTTPPPALPATDAPASCYAQMFYGCTSLREAPSVIAATSSASKSFSQMFQDCITLVSAPETLPLASVADNACQQMFKGCTSLLNAPSMPYIQSVGASGCHEMYSGCSELTDTPDVLPATVIGNSAYHSMFINCPKIKTAPDLGAVTVGTSAMRQMFRGCTRLSKAPSKLSIESVPANACQEMFYGCTSLSTVPDLSSVTEVGQEGFRSMFYACSNISTPPVMSSGEVSVGDYGFYQMFFQCSALTAAPQVKFKFISTGTSATPMRCFQMFYQCSSLLSAEGLRLPPVVQQRDCEQMFINCISLTTPPDMSGITEVQSSFTRKADGSVNANYGGFKQMFYGCTALSSPPDLSHLETVGPFSCVLMFYNCSSLKTPPESLPAETLDEGCYYQMFQSSGLTTAPLLPATEMKKECYRQMFKDCRSLEQPPVLPATVLAESCYRTMFENSSSLTAAPDLPAEELAPYCYYYMFNGCSKLAAVTCLATDISATNALTDWLKNVSKTGNFTRPASMSGAWTSGTSGIPSGWTVVDYSE